MQNGFEDVSLAFHGYTNGKIPIPTIGANGNWFLGTDDTGINANGLPGPKGPKGDPGEPGPVGAKGDDGQAADMSRVVALEGQIANLYSALEWRLFGTTTTLNQPIAMPAVPYREIMAVDNMNGSMYSILIPAKEITVNKTDWSSGMYNGSAGSQFLVSVSTTTIYAARSRYNNEEKTSIFTFYYR